MTPSGTSKRPRPKASGSRASSSRACSIFIVIASVAKQSRFCAAGLPRRFAPRNGGLELRQRHALLAHIFAGAVGVAHLARLVALEEQELARAFVGIDLGRKRGRVREFERHMALPAGL